MIAINIIDKTFIDIIIIWLLLPLLLLLSILFI